ncbi:MAG: ABC transporter substrate-binding protein [Burkholderiales bacterium]|nr:ABC transporter substrate-binding protein [Burkholderiales bacterium]
MTTPVSVIVFPGGFNLPLWVAEANGLFAANGVAVSVTPTPNSVFQLTGLIEGKFDVAMTAIDNVVAYREGQGEAPVEGPELFAFMGGDRGFLQLVTAPEVKSYGDLRGKVLSVDARTTGYAFVLLELLERAGLREPDFALERAGGVLQRFEALLAGKHAGTLLVTPFDLIAQAKGCNRLADALAVLGRYQGLVGAARRPWAERNRDAIVGYVRAYAAAVDWLYDPANRDAAIELFARNVPNAARATAEAACRALLDPAQGFQKRAQIDLEGVRTVLALRSKYGEPRKTLTDPAAYYDPRFHDAAMNH